MSKIHANVNDIKSAIVKHPIVFGVSIALVLSVSFCLPYIVQDGLKYSTADKFGDMFSGLPFVIERTYVSKVWSCPFYAWSPFTSAPSFVGDSNFFIVPQLIFFQLIPDVIVSYKLLEITLLSISFLSMYLLTYFVTDKMRIASALFSGIFYSLTPYLLFELIAHQYMMWAYALLPLAFLSIYMCLKSNEHQKYMWVFVSGLLIAGSTTFAAIEFAYVTGIFLFIFGLVLCLRYFREPKLMVNLIIRFSFMFVVAILLSSYFMFPTLYQAGPFSVSSVFSRIPEVPTYSNTFTDAVFLLNKGLISNIGLDYFQTYGFLLIPFSFPIILGTTLVFKMRKFYFLFFALGILAIVLSMGVNLPPPLRLFELAQKLPLFSLIRTPCRFTIQIALSFSLLGGIGIGLLLGKLTNHRLFGCRTIKGCYKPVIVWLSVAIIACAYLFSATAIAYSVAGPFENQTLPKAAFDTVTWLNSQDPQQNYRIIDLTQSNIVVSYHRSLTIGPELVFKYYCSPSFALLLGMLNVKYLIVDLSSNLNQALWNSSSFNRTLINNFVVYTNELARPEFYLSNSALVIGGPNVLSTFYSALESQREKKIDNTSNTLPNWCFFNTAELKNKVFKASDFDALVFEDSDIMDYVFQSLNSTFTVQAYNYVNPNWRIIDQSSGGLTPSSKSYQNAVDGQLIFSERAVYANQNATMAIPLAVNEPGLYDIWIRASSAFPTETNNSISLSLNSMFIGQAEFSKKFNWIKISKESIPINGASSLQLSTSQPIYLDMLAITPKGLIDDLRTSVTNEFSDLPHMFIYEFSNYFNSEKGIRENTALPYSSNANSGYLTLPANSSATQQLFIDKDSNYTINLRYLQDQNAGDFALKIDNVTVASVNTSGNASWRWTSANSISLSQGEHEATIISRSGNNSVDLMFLMENSLGLKLAGVSGNVNFSEVQLNNWSGSIYIPKPAYLIFTESFYPEWSMQLQRDNISTIADPAQAFYSLNAYYLSNQGSFTFEVHHFTSEVRGISIATSIVTFSFSILVIAVSLVMKYKRRRYIERTELWLKGA